jgi:hypothetical protein
MCIAFLSSFLLKLFLFSEEFRDIIINVRRSFCEVPVILVKFWCNLNFLDRSSRNHEISDLIKTRPLRAMLFHADRQTWQSLMVFFRNFANVPNNRYFDANIFLSFYVRVQLLIAPFTYYRPVLLIYWYWYTRICQVQLGWHPVAVHIYT